MCRAILPLASLIIDCKQCLLRKSVGKNTKQVSMFKHNCECDTQVVSEEQRCHELLEAQVLEDTPKERLHLCGTWMASTLVTK